MATKMRQAVVMSTPQRSTKQRSVYSETDKKSLLDNFDLEVNDKTRAFKASLTAMLSSFALRQEAEILKLPRELRSMKLGDLEKKWAGSWKETVQKMLQDKIEERERAEKAERERAAEEEMKLKRKRAEEAAEGSPGRNNKNARREPGTAQKVVPGSTSKRRPNAKTPRSKPSGSNSTNAGPSTLPQDHIFNPRLPPTPSFPRQAKRNESFFSANGSPILIPYTGSSPSAAQPDDDDHGTEAARPPAPVGTETDDEDLPDPAVLEAQILAQTKAQSPKSKPSSSSQGRRPKRGPSLVFRKSMAAGAATVAPAEQDDDGVEYSTIELSDGRAITFNPFELRPDQVEKELNEGGLDRKEKNSVMQRVKEEAHKALTARMERWKVS